MVVVSVHTVVSKTVAMYHAEKKILDQDLRIARYSTQEEPRQLPSASDNSTAAPQIALYPSSSVELLLESSDSALPDTSNGEEGTRHGSSEGKDGTRSSEGAEGGKEESSEGGGEGREGETKEAKVKAVEGTGDSVVVDIAQDQLLLVSDTITVLKLIMV